MKTIEELQSELEAMTSERDGLASKNSELLNETKSAKSKAKADAEAASKAAEEAARKSGDFEALDKSWSEKYETGVNNIKTELQSKIDLMTSAAEKSNVTAVAQSLASDLFASSELGLPHIQGRIGMQMQDDGSFKTVVKDANGELSAMTIDELREEIKSSEMFKPILKGSQGAGGGAPGGKGGEPAAGKGTRESMKAAISKRLKAQGIK